MWRAAAKVTRIAAGAFLPTMPGLQKARGLVASPLGSFCRFFFSQIRSCSAPSASSVKPVIAAKEPFPVDLIAEKRYAWCACGHSQKQPFCDGTHKKSAPEMSSLKFTAGESKKAWLCGCKYTKNPPYCDGTHKEDFVQKADLHSQPQGDCCGNERSDRTHQEIRPGANVSGDTTVETLLK